MAKRKAIKSNKPAFSDLKKDAEDYRAKFYNLMSYAQYEVSNKDLMKEALKWVKKNSTIDSKILFTLPDNRFEIIGKYCMIENQGGELSDQHRATVLRILDEMFVVAVRKNDIKLADAKAEDKEKATPVKKRGVQDYMKEKSSEVCGELEAWVDEYIAQPGKDTDLRTRDVKKHFTAADLKANHLRFVKGFYEDDIKELKDVIKGEDADLKEGYSHLNKIQVKRLLEFYENVVSVADFLRTSGLSTRKPRKKKATDIGKMVSKLKFLEKDDDTGIVSVKPRQIVGAKDVWVYNTKTRKIGHYIAADDSGLSVKGTSIKNFSEKSMTRTIRKNSKFNLVKFVKANKSAKKKEFTGINSLETKLNGRLNEHTLILSVG